MVSCEQIVFSSQCQWSDRILYDIIIYFYIAVICVFCKLTPSLDQIDYGFSYRR